MLHKIRVHMQSH